MAKPKRKSVLLSRNRNVRPSVRVAPLSDAGAEAAAWANVSGFAQSALTFWNAFIGLRSGAAVLDAAALGRLMCIIRAVSWVESQHGTGSGTSASVDPMQSANPRDAWWTELTDCSGTQDRFVRGPGSTPNYNACELPAAAAGDGSFPQAAKLSNLGTITSGHDDANFVALMSYCWGVPFLIWKINNPAGDPTYQCQDLSRDRLVAGAVAYNGGGDPTYQAKINAALDLIGCLPTLDFVPISRRDPQQIVAFCEQEYPNKNDDCNKFVKAVSNDLNVTLFQPGDNADTIVQRLRDAGDWTRLADGIDAKNRSDSGQYVIAGLKAADHTPPRSHGHVAVVVTGTLASGKYPHGYWGSLDGPPGRNQTLNYAWNASDRDNVEYYGKAALRTAVDQAAGDNAVAAENAAVSIVQEIVSQFKREADPGKPGKFFPEGIELIDITVQVGVTQIHVKVAGPKTPAG